ncbi:FtsX-like permease family protein [Micromonospora sp. NPDC051296]|uniref:FtsX-like permease family protein n=1 Tax=Micromonospora sp. NPDC051296 TaxID=3155046 RepID=UPI003413540F
MRPATLVRLALAGTRTDTARVTLTTLSAVLATLPGLAALTVLAIPTPPATDDNPNRWSEQYTIQLLVEPGLRGGTAFALLLLAIPVLALAGQSARLGAPGRDRRLAALRLAGATPGQVTRLAMLETGLASLVGTLVGLAGYLVGRKLLHNPDASGRLVLPTDVLPSVPAMAAVVLGLPLVAAAATAVMLRRVTATPLGVVRRARRAGAPRPWPALLIGLGVLAVAMIDPILRALRDTRLDWLSADPATRDMVIALVAVLVVFVGLFAGVVGVILGAGWISYFAGHLLHRFARGPAALLAARRLTDDPWAGSRTFAALLASLVVGAGAAAFRARFLLDEQIQREQSRQAGYDDYAGPFSSFYLSTMDLVDLTVVTAVAIAAAGLLVTLVEGIVTRRRAYAALVATGVPRTTIATSILWQVLAPAVPAVLVALGVGHGLGRQFVGDHVTGGFQQAVCGASAELCQDPATRDRYTEIVQVERVIHSPDVPLEQLALLGAGAVAAVLITAGLGLLFLRANTAVEELRST